MFERLKEGGAQCPSDLVLDRVHAGELAPDAHVSTCAQCQARLARRVFPTELDERRVLAKVRAHNKKTSWWAWAWAPAALAAALMLFLSEDAVREKGALGLRVFREGSGEIVSGTRVSPGDKLRFVVDLPSPAEIAIIGVEASGHVYKAWPLDAKNERVWPQGKARELPEAVTLDSTLGKETLFLVHCGPAKPVCQTPPSCGECQVSPFVMEKVAR